MKDIIIKCIECKQEFPFTQGEQEFYQQKELKPPVRCPICRAAFKQAQEDKFRAKIKRL